MALNLNSYQLEKSKICLISLIFRNSDTKQLPEKCYQSATHPIFHPSYQDVYECSSMIIFRELSSVTTVWSLKNLIPNIVIKIVLLMCIINHELVYCTSLDQLIAPRT